MADDDIEIRTTAHPFTAGDDLYSLTIKYVNEDDDAINVDVHIRINEHCDPHEYMDVFIDSLTGIVDRLKLAKERMIAIETGMRN